jgi:hypothetical protein
MTKKERKIDWVRVALGVTIVAVVGTMWYAVYNANRAQLEMSREAKRHTKVLRSLGETAGRRFPMNATYEGMKKDEVASQLL